MKKALVLVGILSGTIAANAGFKAFVPVGIGWYDSGGYGRGSLGDARASSSKDEWIGCYHDATSYYRGAQCFAVSAKGETVGCWTSDPKMMATVETLHGDSHLWFDFELAGGTCARIMVFNASQFQAKTP